MKDPILVLGWVWAAYVAIRLAGELVDMVFLPGMLAAGTHTAQAAPPADDQGQGGGTRPWSPLPAVKWLAGEIVLAAVVVGVAWYYLRDATPNLLPGAIAADPADVRHVAVAAIIGWSLLAINVPVAMRLIGRLLPADTEPASGGVDPARMGATIGVLERLLIVALLPGGGAAAVGLVVAAKTLARFKELDDKRFAERYLLGTMTSVTIALASAIAAQWLWSSQL